MAKEKKKLIKLIKKIKNENAILYFYDFIKLKLERSNFN